MWTIATLCAIVAALNGILLPCSASSESVLQSASFRREFFSHELELSGITVENATVYYAYCDKYGEQTEKKCTIRRRGADLTSKQDECNITLRSESGGVIKTDLIKIEPFGKDRVIVRWLEDTGRKHLRFSIVNFSDCKVKTTKLSEDLDRLIMAVNHTEEFNKLTYLIGEYDFEVVLSGVVWLHDELGVIHRSLIDAEGVASKVDTLVSYSGHRTKRIVPYIFPLSRDKGYLLVDLVYHNTKPSSITVAHVQSNGQRQNLTHLDNAFSPLVSLANGLIGMCARQADDYLKCTQFKLGDKQINWHTAMIVERSYCLGIYNLPDGEGFLAVKHGVETPICYHEEIDYWRNVAVDETIDDLIKISLESEPTQLYRRHIDMRCPDDQKPTTTKVSNDEKGNYLLNIVCVKTSKDDDNSIPDLNYLQFQSKCFKPEDLTTFEKITGEFFHQEEEREADYDYVPRYAEYYEP
uniref:Uncharacterized protein n=1 Tax=Trichogramma kaykai TaxID=54128 RepID=A0ABD2X4C4_9HYME